METDGASDETPRFPKPLATATALFKSLGLDVLIHGVSGCSAFYPVERGIAPPLR